MMGRRHSQFKKILVGYDGSAQADKALSCFYCLATVNLKIPGSHPPGLFLSLSPLFAYS
jgi:hypothetical protein